MGPTVGTWQPEVNSRRGSQTTCPFYSSLTHWSLQQKWTSAHSRASSAWWPGWAFSSKYSSCPSSMCGLWMMDRWLALLCLSIHICQMRDTEGALRAVAEAHPKGADPVWLCVGISDSVTYTHLRILGILWVGRKSCYFSYQAVGKLWPGQMKPQAQGCRAISGSVRHR